MVLIRVHRAARSESEDDGRDDEQDEGIRDGHGGHARREGRARVGQGRVGQADSVRDRGQGLAADPPIRCRRGEAVGERAGRFGFRSCFRDGRGGEGFRQAPDGKTRC